MPEITLARHWNPGNDHYAPGDVVDVNEAVAEWLTRTGAAADKVVVEAVVEVPVNGGKTEGADADEGEKAPATVVAEASRPARTASIDEWREFAEDQGIATKGLSKQELIAATR